MLDTLRVMRYDSVMTCCDGTGWTGVEGVICAEHYDPCGGLLELGHSDPLAEWEWEDGPAF
jgi:hypothetical protein